MGSPGLATFGGTITLRRRHAPATIVDPVTLEPSAPSADATDPVDDDPTPLRDEIRLGELDRVIEEAIQIHWPELEANVVTSHSDK